MLELAALVVLSMITMYVVCIIIVFIIAYFQRDVRQDGK